MSFLLIPIQTYPNTALGYQSLISSNLDPSILGGSPNTGFGYLSLNANYTGSFNSAFGNLSMQKNTIGTGNSSFGNVSLQENISGNFNSSFGDGSLAINTIGSDNSSFGYQSAGRLISGNKNSVFGVRALWGALLAESENSAFGFESLVSLSGGTRNSAFGYQSGSAITSGSKNSILGSYSGNQGGLDIRTLSNYIVLSDGDGNPRLWITNTGAVNIPGGTVLPGGVANGVLYLNGSKVVTSGSGLTFDGTNLGIGTSSPAYKLDVQGDVRINGGNQLRFFRPDNSTQGLYIFSNASNNFIQAPVGAIIFDGTNSLTFDVTGVVTWRNSGGVSERMRLDASGNLGIGTTSADIFGLGGRIIGLQGSTSVNFQMFQGSKGFYAQATATDVTLRSYLAPLTIETQGANAIILRTDATERVRLDTSGNVIINTGAIATNATNGFFYVAGCGGTPTGVPTAFTGRVPIVVDTTNHKLYFYSGGAWRDAGP